MINDLPAVEGGREEGKELSWVSWGWHWGDKIGRASCRERV